MAILSAGMTSDSVALTGEDALIRNYLKLIRKAAWYLPRDRRDRIVTQVAEHVIGSIDAEDNDGQQLGDLLARLGEPKDVVRAIDGHIPGTAAGWVEFAAVVLLLVGGVFWNVGWAVGLVLLWVSPRWRWPDKLLGSLIWPGGLLITRLLLVHYAISTFIAAGFVTGSSGLTTGPGLRPRSSLNFIIDATVGHPAWRHVAVLLAAGAPPVLVGIRLLRRARRPVLPQVADLSQLAL